MFKITVIILVLLVGHGCIETPAVGQYVDCNDVEVEEYRRKHKKRGKKETFVREYVQKECTYCDNFGCKVHRFRI